MIDVDRSYALTGDSRFIFGISVVFSTSEGSSIMMLFNCLSKFLSALYFGIHNLRPT